MGIVGEVLPRRSLLPRAWELAERLAQKPATTLRHTRELLIHPIKRQLQEGLGYGLSLEALSIEAAVNPPSQSPQTKQS